MQETGPTVYSPYPRRSESLTISRLVTRNPFLEGSKKHLHPESSSKITNLITELIYSYIFNINRATFIHEDSGVHTSEFSDTEEFKKMALQARKVSGAFEKRVPET